MGIVAQLTSYSCMAWEGGELPLYCKLRSLWLLQQGVPQSGQAQRPQRGHPTEDEAPGGLDDAPQLHEGRRNPDRQKPSGLRKAAEGDLDSHPRREGQLSRTQSKNSCQGSGGGSGGSNGKAMVHGSKGPRFISQCDICSLSFL